MRKLLIVGAVALLPMTMAPQPALAQTPETTVTLAYAFAATLMGTAAGAFLVPYVAPAVAPTVAATYGAVAVGLDAALTSAGAFILYEPRMIGAVAGMATGLATGLALAK